MLGISIFPGLDYSIEENINYMDKAHKNNIEYIFTSVHIPNLDRERVKTEFIKILEEANKRNMKLIVDISKNFYLEFDWNKYSVYALRLDFGFDDAEIVRLSQEYNIQLNASTVSKEWASELVKLGIVLENVSVCHNYYPRVNTGISIELLRERNKFFKELGLTVMAFVPSQSHKRGPIYEGLPTVESHRHIHPIIGAQELLYENVDVVLVGDSMSSDEELSALGKIKKDEWLLPSLFFTESKNKFDNFISITHKQRMDTANSVIRSEVFASDNKDIPLYNTIKRNKGSITLDNKLYGRYSGSIQITKENLTSDYRVNVLGYVCDDGILLKRIKEADKFSFYSI